MTAILEPAGPAVTRRDDWRESARCQTEPATFYTTSDANDDEPPYPTEPQRACCNLCPVRTDCLNHALDTHEPAGVWGGMTYYQRTLLLRVRSRKSCPGCGANDTISEGGSARQHEVCLACGISWFV